VLPVDGNPNATSQVSSSPRRCRRIGGRGVGRAYSGMQLRCGSTFEGNPRVRSSAERPMMLAAPHLGRDVAHKLLEQACGKYGAVEQKRPPSAKVLGKCRRSLACLDQAHSKPSTIEQIYLGVARSFAPPAATHNRRTLMTKRSKHLAFATLNKIRAFYRLEGRAGSSGLGLSQIPRADHGNVGPADIRPSRLISRCCAMTLVGHGASDVSQVSIQWSNSAATVADSPMLFAFRSSPFAAFPWRRHWTMAGCQCAGRVNRASAGHTSRGSCRHLEARGQAVLKDAWLQC